MVKGEVSVKITGCDRSAMNGSVRRGEIVRGGEIVKPLRLRQWEVRIPP